MSTIVENTNPVTVDIEPKYSVTTQSGAIVENKAPEYSVSIQRKEYKVVGDNIYIPRLYDDAPRWMKDLVNTVVDVKTAVAVGNLDDALEALRTLSDELEVAKNTYTNSIISSNDIDQRINTAIETLNSALSDADATILNIAQTATTPAEASAIALNTLSASLSASGEIGSFISNMNSAFADLDNTTTQSINFMESAINAEFSANATALNTIRTYVGIDGDGNGTGTGLLADIEILQKQNDGIIETVSGEWDVMLNAQDPDMAQLVIGAEPYASWKALDVSGIDTRLAHIGDVYIKYSTTANGAKEYIASYKFIRTTVDTTSPYSTDTDGFTWALIVDQAAQDAYEQALNAYELADSKSSVRYGTLVQRDATSSAWTAAEKTSNIGDIWIISDAGPDQHKQFRWNGSGWVDVRDKKIIANAEAITQLGVDIANEAGLRAAGDTTVTNTVKAYADSVGAGVESKWEYGSTLSIDGKSYVSGFGLVSNTTHGVIGAPASGSEFWISADKFKLSASGGKGSSYTPFSVNATTGDITFKGKVTFGSNQSGTIEEAIASTIETVQVGDKNINITDNLIPITSLVGDTNNASYQFIGTPTKSNEAGIDTFAEPQISLESSDEVYSPYVDEVTIPYYFRIGIKGITSLDRIKICTINLSNVVTYGILTYTMNNGESLDPLQWYIVDGIINPVGGNTAASGSIRKADGTKIGTINNYSIPSGALKILLGFVANCVISRMKLAKITADTLTGNYVTQDYVDNSVDTVSWETLKNKDSFAQKLGYNNYAQLELAASSGQTIINGGYINTSLIQADSIMANQINTTGLVAENISADTIHGKKITGGSMYGTYIEGAIIKASFIDLSSTATLTNWQKYTPATYPSEYDANFAKNNDGTLLVDSLGYVRLMGNTQLVSGGISYTNNYVPNSNYAPAASIPAYEISIHGYDDYTTYTINRMIKSTHTMSLSANQVFNFASVAGSANGTGDGYCSGSFYVHSDYYEIYVYLSMYKGVYSSSSGYIKKNGVTVASSTAQAAVMVSYSISILGFSCTLSGGLSAYGGLGFSLKSDNVINGGTALSISNLYGPAFKLVSAYATQRMGLSSSIPVITII